MHLYNYNYIYTRNTTYYSYILLYILFIILIYIIYKCIIQLSLYYFFGSFFRRFFMLKIYLRTLKYEIHNKGKIAKLNFDTHYVIRDEEVAVPKTIELGAYTDKAHRAYVYSSNVEQKKKGKQAYYYGWPCDVHLQEWKAPDAKLVMHVTYKEDDCSMKELMTLPTQDVIAYLKQEGMNLIVPT